MKCLVLGVALVIAGCGENQDSCDMEPISKQLTIATPAEPSLQLAVDSCRVDVDACPALCELALEKVQISHAGVSACEVGFADVEVRMDVAYQTVNCFFGGGDVVFAKGGAQ